MEKPATPDYPIHDLIKQRWSPRAFSSEPVQPEVLRSLLEAARWAASCRNEQPWRFIIAQQQNPEEFGKLLSCLTEGNQIWAKHAPVLLLSIANTTFAHNGLPNRHAFHDVGQAIAQLSLQATALGLHVHHMAGYSPERAREVLEIPGDHEPVAVTAIGHMGRLQDLPEELRQREIAARTRRPQNEFVFGGAWGKPLP